MQGRAPLIQLAVWVVLAAGLTVMWLRYGASTATTVLTILTGAAAVTQVLVSTIGSRGTRVSSAEQLDDTLQTLGIEVQRQWTVEAHRRLLDDTQRLAVRARVSGAVVEVSSLVADYADNPRRMVIVGAPGSGKTSLGLLLLLEILHRPPITRVPVLLQVSAWDPEENLDAWLLRSILDMYPFLGNEARFGATAARDLLATHRILPILDGLDEMVAGRRNAALHALDADRAHEPIVLTCRSAEFDGANETGAIHDADLVRLLPLDDDAVADYLLESVTSQRLSKWEQVLDRLSDGVSDPLVETLRTPLMLSLARATYRDPRTDPSELLELDTSERVTTRLLDEFARHAFVARPPSPLGETPRPVRRWPPDAAERWLTFLARRGDRDIGWWQLWREVPRWVFVVSGVCTGGSLATLLGWLLLGLFGQGGLGALLGLAIGTTFGAAIGLVPTEAPRRFVPRMLRRKEIGVDLLYAVIGAIAGGVAVGAVYGGAYGSAAGLVFGVAYGLVRRFTEPSESKEAITPASVARSDKLAIAYAAGLGAVLGAATGGLLAGALGADDLVLPIDNPVLVVLLGIAVGALLGAGGLGLVVMGTSSTGRFNPTRLWLAARGVAPLRLMRFLADAHQCGVLRLAGPYYQFRHELLRDHLASRP